MGCILSLVEQLSRDLRNTHKGLGQLSAILFHQGEAPKNSEISCFFEIRVFLICAIKKYRDVHNQF